VPVTCSTARGNACAARPSCLRHTAA
jgi:hypothetical protein